MAVPNGLHQLDARRRQRLARLLDLLVARQQLRQIERRANIADALAGSAGTRDVVQQVIQQVVDRMLVIREPGLRRSRA